jgi:anti-sigma regulatory factor (Ser/Thr protein kinase)
MTQSMENELTVRIEAPAETIMVTPLDLFVRDLIQQFPAFSKSEGLVDMLELAFHEAFTNIGNHAYRSELKCRVTVQIWVGLQQLEFRFEDNGESFDPDKVPTPNFEGPCEEGLGIWLIRQIMDKYLYHSEKGSKNVLRLIKNIPGSIPDGMLSRDHGTK